ncbi:MAG: transcriptional regulator [Prevotella sp.]|nr:transcriptional regulator [Prevotella sp.]
MSTFKFAVINPLLHNELRLKIMVALDSLESADFMYLCQITDSTRGNLSVQITTLKDAGYLEVSKTGLGRFARTVCRITRKGAEALRVYEDGLRRMFTERVPENDAGMVNRR